MNLTSKKKFVLENNGVAFNPHTSSHNSTSPYKQNEKIIYLPKDFLKNNNIISTPITNTETNITIYNNASKQTTTNPNTLRCQPNLLLYNKNFYKHPLILKNKHNNNTNTTNNTNNNSNNNMSTHSQIIPTNINISTIDNKDISINSSVTMNNISKPKGKIVSKVISFSKDKLEQIQQSKQQMLCCCYNSEGNVNAQYCSNNSGNMIYTRKRSKDRNKLKLIDERRKMCKSVKELNTNTFGEGGECNGYNNSLLTSVEGLIKGKSGIIQQDKDKDGINNNNNDGNDCSSFGNGQRVTTEKDVKCSMQGKKGSNVKQRIQLTKEVINDNNTNTLIHSILNTPSHKNTITIDNDNNNTITHNEVSNKVNKETLNNDKLLTLLKQKVERMKESHKRQTEKFNNSNNNSNSNNSNSNNEKYYLSNFNINENQFKTTSTSSSKCSVSLNKSNNVLKDNYCHYTFNTPLSTESGFKQVYSTPNTKHVHSTKYYEEVSPKQIVCGNIISSPNVTKRQTHSSLKSSLRLNNNNNNKDNNNSNSEYNYYVYSQVLNKHNNTKTKHNVKVNEEISKDTTNTNAVINETHLTSKNNIKDKLYTLEFINNTINNNNNNNNNSNNATIEHDDNNNTISQSTTTTIGNKDKKYRLIYDYERIAKEARHTLYNTINIDSTTDNNNIYDSSIHKKTQSVRDLKERKHITTEDDDDDDEYINHKKTNSVRIYQNNNTTHNNTNPYYTIITQVNNKPKHDHKTYNNNTNIELLSFVSKLPSKTNNVLIETIPKTSLSKLSTSSSLYNKYSKY